MPHLCVKFHTDSSTISVCCSVLQCVAVRCSVVQCSAEYYSVVQCVAVWCSVLQCVLVSHLNRSWTRPKSFLEADLRPLCPSVVYRLLLSRAKPAFWISARNAIVVGAGVDTSGRVRHPPYFTKLLVRLNESRFAHEWGISHPNRMWNASFIRTVCCSVLQCVAVRCSVLQCDAVCCSVLQCVAVCCSVMQCAHIRIGCEMPHSFGCEMPHSERWGAGVEYHFQEFNEPYASS